jgi:hypothetical protein
VSERLAILAAGDLAALHGLDGRFPWGDARTYAPGDPSLDAWAPDTVISVGGPPVPEGPWRAIHFGGGPTRVVSADSAHAWRRALLPGSDALADLHGHAGSGVVVAGGTEAGRSSVLAKLRARHVDVTATASLTRQALADAYVVALLGAPGDPLPADATAVLAAGRVLLVPRAEPTFGLLPWSDHLPYENEDDLVRTADAAQTHPAAFEPIVAMGMLAAEAHLASAVYHRLAVDAELEDAAAEA